MPSGIAVAASPALWIRSASSATLPEATNTATWATRGERQHAERERDGAEALAGALDRVVDEPVRMPVRM